MAEIISGILLIILGTGILGGGITAIALFNENLRVAFRSDSSFLIFIFTFIAISGLFIYLGIYIIRKNSFENRKIDRLNAIGTRAIGIVKNVTYQKKKKDLMQFSLEVVVSDKGTKHSFLSDWVSYFATSIHPGDKLYIIYDRDDYSKYAIIYDQKPDDNKK